LRVPSRGDTVDSNYSFNGVDENLNQLSEIELNYNSNLFKKELKSINETAAAVDNDNNHRHHHHHQQQTQTKQPTLKKQNVQIISSSNPNHHHHNNHNQQTQIDRTVKSATLDSARGVSSSINENLLVCR
jgi:hypothetical protein